MQQEVESAERNHSDKQMLFDRVTLAARAELRRFEDQKVCSRACRFFFSLSVSLSLSVSFLFFLFLFFFFFFFFFFNSSSSPFFLSFLLSP